METVEELHKLSVGYLFNHFRGRNPEYNKLHNIESCNQLSKMNLTYDKYYANDLGEMLTFLKNKIGEEEEIWSRCKICF